MTHVSTNVRSAASAEVTAIDTQARWPLLLLIGSGLAWLVLSGVFALITSIQLHSPAFLADCEWLTFGRAQAMGETAFIYGWAANAGLAVALWVLGRLGGYPLRALNWTIVGALFWNLGVTVGIIGIAIGDMTSFSLLQPPRYVQPLLVFAWATMAISGVLAWSGRRTDGTFASQWYAVAALFLFPWMLIAAQAVLLWFPVRGVAQAIAAGWYTQGAWTLWLAPLALAGAYYVTPKVAGRVLPAYEDAPLAFWTLIFVGAWTGGRHLIGGPVPAWIPTMAIVSAVLLLFHYLVVALNFRIVFTAKGTAIRFIRFGIIAYLLIGAVETITAFRAVAVETQFTFVMNAVSQLGLYGAVSMLLFGAIYYMVPRITGNAWASSGLTGGHTAMVMFGVVASVLTLFVAGWTQGASLLNAKVPMSAVFGDVKLSLLINSGTQIILIGANLLLLVNFCRTACVCKPALAPAPDIFRQPGTLEVPAS
jgi:cytochrome c oxidase cbb3-type subunit I